jgi:hypothetical protein
LVEQFERARPCPGEPLLCNTVNAARQATAWYYRQHHRAVDNDRDHTALIPAEVVARSVADGGDARLYDRGPHQQLSGFGSLLGGYARRTCSLLSGSLILFLFVLLYEITIFYVGLIGAVRAQSRERGARLITGDAVAEQFKGNDRIRLELPDPLELIRKRDLVRRDPFFAPEGAEAFRRDLPAARIVLLETGHFALETDGGKVADEN